MRLVPERRLLFCFAVVAVPCSLIAMAGETGLVIAALAFGSLALVAVIDALRGMAVTEGISVELPDVTRLARERAGQFEVRLQNRSQKARRLRIGLALPDALGSEQEVANAVLPAGVEWSALPWHCRPAERGSYRITRAWLEAASPFGLWAVRWQAPVQSEVRVYPNLLTERRQLAAMFLHRGSFGLHAQRQVGKGRDFEKLREYIPGDGLDEIHWKATAKRGHPVTKVFQIERTQEVYVLIDASRLSGRACDGVPTLNSQLSTLNSQTALNSQSTLERYVTGALVLGLAAEQQGDLFGLVTFSDRLGGFLRAKSGRAHFNACRDALYTLKSQAVTPDFEEVASFVRLRLRRRALLLFLTDLDDPVLAENFIKSMDLLCRQHLVIVGMIRPRGAEALFSDAGARTVDDVYDRLGGHMRWHRLRELEKVLGRRGVRLQLLDRAELSAELVSSYVAVKQRQLL